MKKGAKLYIEGQLQTRKWQDQQGQDRYSTEVVLQGFNGVLTMLDSRGAGAGAGAGGWQEDRARQTTARAAADGGSVGWQLRRRCSAARSPSAAGKSGGTRRQELRQEARRRDPVLNLFAKVR